VAADFIHSPEAVDQVVDSFYVNYLRRQPDPTSVSWSTYLEGANGSASVVEQAFLASPEYQSRASANTQVSSGSASAVVESSWYAANLADPQLASLVQGDMTTNGQLTRADMIAIFAEVQGGGAVTQAEYDDLQMIVGNSTEIVMTPSVRNLATKVVGNSLDGNQLPTQEYQGQAMGNLAVGTTATQLGELVDEWFKGLDLPTAAYPYATPAGALFGPGGSLGYSQVFQAADADCFFMATIASLAVHDPQAIKNMIVPNGDGTYTVEFFASINNVLTPDYVTVNGELPSNEGSFYYAWGSDVSGEGLFNNSDNVLWAPLLEKAFAQWTAEGYNIAVTDSSNPAANSYAAINTGSPGYAIQEETGDASYVESDSVLTTLTFTQVTAAYDAGSNITFGSDYTKTAANVESNHDYAMIGYDAGNQTITLFNPWGVDGGDDSDVFKQGLLVMTMADINDNFSDIVYLRGTITT
jgi:Calpain family cysteine protease